MTEAALPSRRKRIVGFFLRDWPETARVVNAEVVTAELSGDDATENEYDVDLVILQDLVEVGILQIGEVVGITVFGLTIEYQDRLTRGINSGRGEL